MNRFSHLYTVCEGPATVEVLRAESGWQPSAPVPCPWAPVLFSCSYSCFFHVVWFCFLRNLFLLCEENKRGFWLFSCVLRILKVGTERRKI